MNLADKDILELSELCSAVLDGEPAEKQISRLSQLLSESSEARQFYVRMMGMSASMCLYAGEMQTGAADAIQLPNRKLRWVVGILGGLAALVTIALGVAIMKHGAPNSPSNPSANEFVAQLTGSKQCQWANGSSSIEPGARIQAGQHVELAKGFAEITFDSGAQVMLQGPASLDVNSAWSATLNRGTLRASLPPEAMGFSISNPTVEVVDLGTEFTMFTDASGAATDVLVLKGEVEAAPSLSADQQPLVLHEKEARRFATSGISSVRDDDKFAALIHPVAIDHFIGSTAYAHWSFDAPGNSFDVDSFGLAPNASPAQLEIDPRTSGSLHIASRWQSALHLDGKSYATAAFPGLSENSPHTVIFWVRVPRNASLSNAYAMVAWGVNNVQLRSHPIQIGWNRNPNEGTVGALRTDYGAGFALGATPLRDGRWHHIAVVFTPRDEAGSPMLVKQYVDGRFEGEGKPSPPGSNAFMTSPENARAANGTFWLGCRLGIKGVRADRFLGDIDELFIADRALEPQEIVELMNTNQLQSPSQLADKAQDQIP